MRYPEEFWFLADWGAEVVVYYGPIEEIPLAGVASVLVAGDAARVGTLLVDATGEIVMSPMLSTSLTGSDMEAVGTLLQRTEEG